MYNNSDIVNEQYNNKIDSCMQYFKQKMTRLKESTTEMITSAKRTIVEGTSAIITEARTSIVGGNGDMTQSIKEQKSILALLHPTKIEDFLVKIVDQLYFMHFPVESVRNEYGDLLKKEFSVNYRVWNVSEHTYEYRCFNDQVNEYVSVGYPNPPLLDIFMVCKEMNSWMMCNPANVAIIHCQKTKTRSILILSCLLFYKGVYQHPAEAIVFLCKSLEMPESTVLDACSSVYANYFSLLISDIKLNSRKVIIQKIVVNELPSTKKRIEHIIGSEETESGKQEEMVQRPYLQLFSQNKLLFSSLNKQ